MRVLDAQICVTFVITCGSPISLLGKETMEALGVHTQDLDRPINVSIHGIGCLTAYHDQAENLRDGNLLGWSFFRNTKVIERFDANAMSVTLFENAAQYHEMITEHRK